MSLQDYAGLNMSDSNGTQNDAYGARLYSANDATISVEFPHLPENINLNREANYKQIAVPTNPDGYHVYVTTQWMEIPLLFKVHALSDYCLSRPEGPGTIFQIAAALHSLALPEITGTDILHVTSVAPSDDQTNGDNADGFVDPRNPTQVTSVAQGTASMRVPKPVVLDLMRFKTRNGSDYGIICLGYIKDVQVTFNGPYLSSTNPNQHRNLPSSAEFKFTFVHNPGYSQDINAPQVNVADAAWIASHFYNTNPLLSANPSVDGLPDTAPEIQGIADPRGFLSNGGSRG